MPETTDGQYLSFGIDGDTFGLPVGKVREVLAYSQPTKLPKSEDFLKGLINVRDVGIPVVDLRLKFGLPEKQQTEDTAILVVELESGQGKITVGAIADEVYEVMDLSDACIESPPRFGTKIDAQFIKSIGKHADGFIIILDLDKAFVGSEATRLEAARLEAGSVLE